jgi:phage tail-like protein
MAQQPPAATPPATAGEGGAPVTWVDPYRAYNFKLAIQGVTAGHFTECSGLGIRVQAIKYREAGSTGVVHRLPGQVDYGDVTLSYGLTQSHELFDWFMTAVSGNCRRKNVSILMLDGTGVTEVMRWDLINAWPSAWRGAPLDALSQEVAIESVTLVFESLQRA